MKKNYQLLKMMLIIASFLTQNILKAQKNFSEYQTDVSSISDKQILLEKIDIRKDSLATNVNTNIYVSYRSGNPQKFWAGLAIATAGALASTQLNSNTNPVEGNTTNNISPVIPLGVSVAVLPSIWKNRPRGVPQAGLSILHRDSRGILLGSWEQPISEEAENSAELLTINIDKPLSEGTLEVYLQNGSKNDVYFWGLHTTTNFVILQKEVILPKPEEQLVSSFSIVGCPSGYVSNGKGNCYNAVNNKSVREGTNDNPIIIRREIGDRLSDLSPKPNITDRKLLPLKPTSDLNLLVCLHYWWCEGGNCVYLYSECNQEEADGGGGGAGGGGTLGPTPQEKQNCITCKRAVKKARDDTKSAAISQFLWTCLWLCTLEGAAGGATVASACTLLEVLPGPGTVAHSILTVIGFIAADIGCMVNESYQCKAVISGAEAAYWTGLKDCGDACPNPN